jgi:hypothetical protein
MRHAPLLVPRLDAGDRHEVDRLPGDLDHPPATEPRRLALNADDRESMLFACVLDQLADEAVDAPDDMSCGIELVDDDVPVHAAA